MFKLSRKHAVLRASFIGVLIVAVASTAVYLMLNRHEESNALTPGGATVQIIDGGDAVIHYGDHHTKFYETKVGSKTYTSYCAEPKKGSPLHENEATVLSSSTTNDLVKFIIYLHQHNNTNTQSLRNSVFDGISSSSYWGDNSTERLYAFTHAVIGIIWKDDDSGLNSSAKTKINNVISELTTAKNNNSRAWQLAQNYQLYVAYGKKTGGTDDQDVVWIEESNPLGSIGVQKCDNETRSCSVPQGNASFAGITVKVYNNSGREVYNPANGNFYANGAEMASSTTNASGAITFSNLPATGVTYRVVETATNSSYQLTAGAQTASLSSDGQRANVSLYNNVNRGNLTVNKIDKETGTCTNSGELSFAGTTLQLINNSTNPVYYNGSNIARGSVVTTKVFSANDCSVSFENLPYGAYQIKETVAATGYVLDSTPKDVSVPSNNSYDVTYTFANQPIRGDVKFVKMDENNEKVMRNVLFSISSLDSNEQIRETHIVVTNQDGVIDTSSSFIPHSINTNGYDELYDDTAVPIVFSGFGTWFGLDKNLNKLPVNDNLGALLYGTYIIQELRCDNNIFCTNIINQKHTIEVTEHNKVIDLGDWNNTCTKFTIETEAVDKKDGDKYIEAGPDTAIKDKISYCAKKNYSFTIKGTLMDKATGEPILIDGKKVQKTVKINPKEDCGKVEMIFPIDSSKLAGKSVVVFEKLFYNGEEMTSHEELDDEEQTVDIIKLKTTATNKEDGTKVLPMDTDAVLQDHVEYCLRPGLEYTIKGIVMDKATGNGLLINSAPVEQELTFTPEKACGELDMFYNINTRGIGGAKLIIFESLYQGDQLILEHRDFNNDSEAFEVFLPAPETGTVTETKSGGQETSPALLIAFILFVAPIGGYVIKRHNARKRFFKY